MELHVFDFDNTLFRSPFRPDWWPIEGWWGKLASLFPPCVPDKPGSEWYVSNSVSAARKSTSDPNVMTVLATGRINKFRPRVMELVRATGLRFDDVVLAAGGSDKTVDMKTKLLGTMLRQHPDIERVEMWEDRVPHVAAFSSFLARQDVEHEIHAVKSRPMQVACTEAEFHQHMEAGTKIQAYNYQR